MTCPIELADGEVLGRCHCGLTVFHVAFSIKTGQPWRYICSDCGVAVGLPDRRAPGNVTGKVAGVGE